MCDTEKFYDIYKDIKALQPEDTLQLIMDAKTEEERDFYEMIGNYFLQKKQHIAVESDDF